MRRQRKLMQQALNPNAIKTYHPLVHNETHTLLRAISADPKNYLDYVRKFVYIFLTLLPLSLWKFATGFADMRSLDTQALSLYMSCMVTK